MNSFIVLLKDWIDNHPRTVFISAGVVVVILMLVYIAWVVQSPPDVATPPGSTPTPTVFDVSHITRVPSNQYPTVPPTPVPDEGDIIITDIAVNDFKKNADKILLNGDVIVKEMETYQIVYLDTYQSFIISITDSDFARSRAAAERDFLGILGIDEANACRLTVQVSSPSFAQNEYGGMTFPLSFCEHHEDGDFHE